MNRSDKESYFHTGRGKKLKQLAYFDENKALSN